jgi:hypothetical protein
MKGDKQTGKYTPCGNLLCLSYLNEPSAQVLRPSSDRFSGFFVVFAQL